MPIYEFYCDRCNTVYSFFSRGVNTTKIPLCPKCKTPLKRRLSVFASIKHGGSEPSDGEMPPIDEAKMEKAMAMFAGEADNLDENDPRQAARLIRKMSDAAGISFGDGMEDALTRLERGEDPDRIEEEMGPLLEGEDPLLFSKKGTGRKKPKPLIDETLYDL